jgi:RNA polymerase sigma-70 factor, ECF subfamily
MSDEQRLIEAARGDQDAFSELVGPYRAELRAHCYRMLGSLPDAEDALQDTLLRAWRGLVSFEGRSSLRSWLYTIATNASLRAIEKRPKRVLPIDYAPAADPHGHPAEALTEPVWLEPYPDAKLGVVADLLGPDARYEQRESIELAFIAALQHLPARQRAVLILRDVLGCSARETARMLATTPVSVDSALQRAHRTIHERVPAHSRQATLRTLGDLPWPPAPLTREALPAPPDQRQRTTRRRRLHLDRANGRLRSGEHHRSHPPPRQHRGNHRLPHPRAVPSVRPARGATEVSGTADPPETPWRTL